MKTFTMILIFTLLVIAFCYSIDDDFVIVDTVFAYTPLTNSIYYNMQSHAFNYYPNISTLEVRYGRSGLGDPGIMEVRAFTTFPIQTIPSNYYIHQVELRLYCTYYFDNSDELVWPHYYSDAYPVQVDHLQYASFTPDLFNLSPLAANVTVLQDSACIGWIGTDITNNYIDDIQHSRTYSQYRLHFPPGYDISGYEIDLVYYGRSGWGTPKLVITYYKHVSNSDDVLPIHAELIKQVYPLPAREVLNIDFTDKDNDDISILIYDIRGRLVHPETRVLILNGIAKVPISEYPSGIYFLKVTDRHRNQMKKITIVR